MSGDRSVNDEFCMTLALAISCVMDPRFKMKYANYFSSTLAGGRADLVVATVLKTIRNLYIDHYLEMDSSSESDAGDRSCKSELDVYLEEPVLPFTNSFSALDWWKSEVFKYPNLSRMAHEFLAVPISLVNSLDAILRNENDEWWNANSYTKSLKPELKDALMRAHEAALAAVICKKQKAMNLH